MVDQSKPLLQRADSDAKEELRVCTAQLQQHWHQVHGKVDAHIDNLETVLKQWQECEDDIEDILMWLKQTRQSLSGELPTSYDQLQAELNKCRVS